MLDCWGFKFMDGCFTSNIEKVVANLMSIRSAPVDLPVFTKVVKGEIAYEEARDKYYGIEFFVEVHLPLMKKWMQINDITDEQIVVFLKKLLPDPALHRAERYWIDKEEYRGKFG